MWNLQWQLVRLPKFLTQLHTSQTTTYPLRHDCLLHYFALLTKPTRIIEIHINEVVSACEWIVCSCEHHRQQPVHCNITIDHNVCASLTEPMWIIEIRINAIVIACEWRVCSYAHHKQQPVHWVISVDRSVSHR